MIYQISSGQGPDECELAAAKFLTYLQTNYEISVLDTSGGYFEGTYRSVRLYTEDDLSEYLGSIQWICRSPYRPEHKRRKGRAKCQQSGDGRKSDLPAHGTGGGLRPGAQPVCQQTEGVGQASGTGQGGQSAGKGGGQKSELEIPHKIGAWKRGGSVFGA